MKKHIKWQQNCNEMFFILMLRTILYIFNQEIYGDNGRIYKIKIYN